MGVVEGAIIAAIAAAIKAVAAAAISALITNSVLATLATIVANIAAQIIATVIVKIAISIALNLIISAVVGLIFPIPDAPGLKTFQGIAVAEIPEVQSASAGDGAKMWRGCGRRGRVSGTIIWAEEPRHFKEDVKLDGVETSVDRYKVNFAVAWGQAFAGTDGAGRIEDIIAVLASGKVIWKKNKTSKYDHRWGSWTNNLGGASASKNSFLQSKLGTNKVSAFRNTAYSVIEDLRLEDIGGGIPQIIEAIVQWDPAGYTLADAVTDIWNRRKGADAATEIDVSRLTGKNTIADTGGGVYPFEGYQVDGPRAITDMLSQFETAFDLTIRHNGTRLQFLDRGDEDVIEVDSGHLGCAEGFAGSGRPITITSIEPRKQPSEVIVQYRAKNRAYQRATETYRLNGVPSGENKAQFEYSGVLLPKQARRIAKRRVYEAYRVGQEVSGVTLPPDYMDTLAGDLVPVALEGQVYYVRAQQVTVGANYIVEIDGVVEQVRAGEDEIITSADGNLGANEDDDPSNDDDPLVTDPEDEDPDGYEPPFLRVAPMNLPPIFIDKDARRSGLYYAHAPEDPAATFKGAKAYRSWKASGGYKIMASSLGESDMGITVGTMPGSTVAGVMLDRATQLRVQMFRGAPTSAVRGDVESGINWVAIGDPSENRWEVAAFLDAEPEDETETDLTGLFLEITGTHQITKVGGATFGSLGITAGSWVRVNGFTSDDVNVEFFRRVATVADDVLDFVVDDVNLAFEGPLGADDEASIVVNSGVYVLSNWFRGLRDTADHASEHAAGDIVVFFTNGSPSFEEMPKAKIGKKARFKSVPKGQDLGDVLAQEIRFVGETMRPFRPCWFKWNRAHVGTDMIEMEELYDINGSFVHRSRFPFQDPTTEENPPHELHAEGKRDEYRVRIYDDAGRTNLVRTIEVVAPDDHDSGETPGRRTFTYTSAQQDTDGTRNVALWFTIFQRGAVVKDGNPLFVEIPAV
jgi:hypothetical protein